MIIGAVMSMDAGSTITLSVILAFAFGYLLTMLPLRRSGVSVRTAFKLALASDTVSIIIMEIVDNVLMLLIPGAMNAGLDQFLFWGSLALALVVAGGAAFPVVRLMIARGHGHAVVHKHHAYISTSHSSHH